MNRLLTVTRRMLEDLTGAPMEETRDWHQVQAALDAGLGDVIVELPWQQPDAQPERHELVLKHAIGDRVVYYNATSPADQPVGTLLSGNATLPERRVEGAGLESMPLDTMERLFTEGDGAALLPARPRGR